MVLTTVLVCLLAFSAYSTADNTDPKPSYVDNVDCSSVGIKFTFSHDSDLYDETDGLHIDLYTGTPPVKVADYKPTTDNVEIDYTDYTITATTVFGPAARPLLYNIEQPFYAYPQPGYGIKRNYTFGVYCTIVAYDNINVTSNTTDNGHGHHGGDVINPQDHVQNELRGTQPDGSSIIGDSLQYVLSLKDDTYAALVPVNCKYFNPSNDAQSLPFVSDSCPRTFPDDPDGYFGTIKQSSPTSYELSFRAFTFETSPNSFLGIECDVLLCIPTNAAACNPTCWGTATTPAAGTTTTATTPGTTESPTTYATGGTTTTTQATSATTSSSFPPRPRRMIARFYPAANQMSNLLQDGDAQSTTITDKKVMKVTIPGVDVDTPSQNSVCTDSSLLSALYAVIGILAILVAMLVIALSYIACARRRGDKADHIYDYPAVPTVAR